MSVNYGFVSAKGLDVWICGCANVRMVWAMPYEAEVFKKGATKKPLDWRLVACVPGILMDYPNIPIKSSAVSVSMRQFQVFTALSSVFKWRILVPTDGDPLFILLLLLFVSMELSPLVITVVVCLFMALLFNKNQK